MDSNKNNDVNSFDKGGYLPASQIEELYDQKINQTSDENIKIKIRRAQMYDPRLEDVHFGSKEAAQKAMVIADKLSAMSEEEFLESDYSYLWLDELAGESIYKVTNPSVLTSV